VVHSRLWMPKWLFRKKTIVPASEKWNQNKKLFFSLPQKFVGTLWLGPDRVVDLFLTLWRCVCTRMLVAAYLSTNFSS
jgi:hypothetical protein